MRSLVVLLLLLLCAPGRAETPRPVVGGLQGHVVQEGEDIFTIARKFHLAVDHLAYANGFPITTVRVAPGTHLIIPTCRVLPARPPRDGLVVNLPERGLYLFQGGRFRAFYAISIGDESVEKGRFQTPTGSFTIIEKIVNPTWYPPSWAPDRTPVGPGPKNPLGERWIGLSLPRVGIHGTSDPLNIGNSLTHGCIRMYPELIKVLYDQVKVGWPVRIEYETAKIGKTGDGKLVWVTYPDVYSRQEPTRAVLAALARCGLKGKPGRKNFTDVAALGLGIPLELGRTDSVAHEVCQRLSWPSEALDP